MITLHYNDATTNILANDSSYRYRSLMAKPQLVLKFSLSEYIEFPIGTWCEYQNERYYLNQPQNIKKNGMRNIEYTLNMGGDEDKLSVYKIRNSIDHRLKWSMCAKPHEFLEEIVKNLNERDGVNVWSVGKCITANEKTIEFNHAYIDAALQDVANAFETEWEIVNHVISLHKVEYFKDNPLPLSYGKGNGFIPGLGRTTASNEQPIKRLYVQGGDRNIDRSKYGSSELLLPKGQTYDYEGRTYKADADGYYIERIDKVSDAVKEDSLDCSETYPSRVGTVSSIEVANTKKNFYDVIDKGIPENLNFNNYLIAGENMTLIFQSGMLAGKEFELKYKHSERRFQLVPQEIDGITMPNETFKPQVGDKYAIFGCMLPNEYICDNVSKTGASWDMFREAARHLYEHEEQKFTFTGTLQSLYAKRNWVNIGGYLIVGGYIHFSDEQFAKNGVNIRITGIKDFINSPYSPTIEISNSVTGKSVSSQLRKTDNQEVVIDDAKRNVMQYTKRRFRDAKETIDMLNSSLLNFSGTINPITIKTMAALIGDEALQFRFVKSRSDLSPITLPIRYDGKKKQLIIDTASFLQHMTLGINSISSTHAVSEYKIWEMVSFTSAVLDDSKKKYYLYAKVSHDTTEIGRFMLSEDAIDMNADSGYYYLLVGILNSEIDGERSYVSLYGFTEILPGRITTDKIVSGDGTSYFDMLANAMKLGDMLQYNVNGDGRLKLRGTIVQSQSGDESSIGCFRGNFNALYTYYSGDEVTYLINGSYSTYRYINATPSKGHLPTETNYWTVVAQGQKGDKGQQGEAGRNGIDGKNGRDGVQGAKGDKGERGPQGLQGIQGPRGEQGVAGAVGANGKTSYFHVKYSNVANPTNASRMNETGGDYLGTYVDFTEADSTDPTKYTWVRTKGAQGINGTNGIAGKNGVDGKTSYLHIAYANSADGKKDFDVSNSAGKFYIGTYTDFVQADSTDPTKYTWALIKGDNGHDGERVFIRYSDDGGKTFTPAKPWVETGEYGGGRNLARNSREFACRPGVGCTSPNPSVHGLRGGERMRVSFDWEVRGIKYTDGGVNGQGDKRFVVQFNREYGFHPFIFLTGKTDDSGHFSQEYTVSEYEYGSSKPITEDTVCAVYMHNEAYTFAGPDGFVKITNLMVTGGPEEHGWAPAPEDRQFGLTPGKYIGIMSWDKPYPPLAPQMYQWSKATGENGKDADYQEYRFAKNGSTTAAPRLDKTVDEPTGWTLEQPVIGKMEYLWGTIAKKKANGTLLTSWSTPIRMTPYDGKDGADGEHPAMVYRGVYDSGKTYYGNKYRLDCVKLGNEFYIARIDAGTFNSPAPPDTSKWNSFGSSFESIATNLLLAEGANIAGWIFRNNRLESQDGAFWLDGKEGKIMANGGFSGALRAESLFMPFVDIYETRNLRKTDPTNIILSSQVSNLTLPHHDYSFSGMFLNIYIPPRIARGSGGSVHGRILCPNKGTIVNNIYIEEYYAKSIYSIYGGVLQIVNVGGIWVLLNGTDYLTYEKA